MQKINYDKVMEEIIESNRKDGLKPKLLLQVCCAPCSTEVLNRLKDDFDIDIYFYNPNIYPNEEFYKRADVLKDLVRQMGEDFKIFVAENNPEEFYSYVANREKDVEGGESCYKCYELRLKETAKMAKEKNYDYFSTTLSISPHKNSAWLNEIGEKLEKEYKIKYLFSDFKKKNGYKNSIEYSKKYGLYRQDYCGCVFSYMEKDERNKNRNWLVVNFYFTWVIIF